MIELKSVLQDDFWIMPATPKYEINGIPYITSKNIKNGKIDFQNANYISVDDYYKISKKRPIKENDILISMIGTLGETAIVTNEDGIFYGQNMFLVRLNQKKIYNQYFMYYFKSNFVKRQLHTKQNKSTQSYLKAGHIESLKINLPSYKTQKEVVKKLDKIVCILNKYKIQIDMLDELVKARFVELFGDPVYNEKQWKVEQFGSLGELKRGKSKHRPRNDPILLGGKYPLIQTGDISNSHTYIQTYKSTYSEEGLKQSKMWKAGTLCITIAANIAESAILTLDACFPDSIVGFLPNDKVNLIFIHHWLDFLQPILEENAPAVAQKNLNVATLEKVGVILPPLELQNQFADFVKEVDKSRLEVQKSLKKTQELFDSLMQKYFG